VDLTTAGHIVLAHGYEGNGTFVTNDPYGDKNKPGYPNVYGKNARTTGRVEQRSHQFRAICLLGGFRVVHASAVTDTLVDDLQIDTGFSSTIRRRFR